MKKLIALLGSLLVLIGIKAQTAPTIKKETLPATTTTKLASQDSLKMSQAKSGKHSPTEKIIKLDSAQISTTKEGKWSPTMKESPTKETKIIPVKETMPIKEVAKPIKK